MAEQKVSLRLFIDPKSQKVIFAEAQKDFVDFLFHILSLPIGSVSKLVHHEGVVRNLYKSVKNLGKSDYMQEGQDLNLLNPKAPIWTSSIPFLPLDKQTFYRCTSCSANLALFDSNISACPTCKNRLTSLRYNQPTQVTNGFVKGLVTYVVTDDLTVEPLLTLSTYIDFLQKFDLKHIGQLQQKDVNMGKNEALMILKACMCSNNILTEVFIKPENENKNTQVSAKATDQFLQG